ncbi:MAG: hypothetical protein B6244_01335 [Candidatus Cloacimonetes bacterium 4572_55]|nr:MAG: hypothetical protein B6244_01335 [Candidatus Cloacimonetes bacterium 4572_55]
MRVGNALTNYFEKNYQKTDGTPTFWYPKENKNRAFEIEPTVQFGYQRIRTYLQRSTFPSVEFVFVPERDWSKTPAHDIFPYGMGYLSNERSVCTIYISQIPPVYYMVQDDDLNLSVVSWHELAHLYLQPPHFSFPKIAPHWLKEGLLQLIVWQLLEESGFDRGPLDPVEVWLKEQTHFTILEYEPSVPIKPAKFAKYQWLLLFMMRDLSIQHKERNNLQLLEDIIPALEKVPQRMDYQKTMDFLSSLIKMNVGDWLSTRWYF